LIFSSYRLPVIIFTIISVFDSVFFRGKNITTHFLNAMFEKYLKKVDAITKEQGLSNDIYLKFRHETAGILHNIDVTLDL